MSAEKCSDSVPDFFEQAKVLEGRLERLNERHRNYCLEVDALKAMLSLRSCPRWVVRRNRLNDLNQRLIPLLQAQIHSLHWQSISGVF